MTTSDIVALAVQIPLVGLFIWFTLKILDRQREERAERDRLWKEFLSTQTQNFLDSMAARDTNWQAFLSAEKDQRAQAMVGASEDLKAVSAGIKELFAAISAHEEAADKRYQTLTKEIRGYKRTSK